MEKEITSDDALILANWLKQYFVEYKNVKIKQVKKISYIFPIYFMMLADYNDYILVEQKRELIYNEFEEYCKKNFDEYNTILSPLLKKYKKIGGYSKMILNEYVSLYSEYLVAKRRYHILRHMKREDEY